MLLYWRDRARHTVVYDHRVYFAGHDALYMFDGVKTTKFDGSGPLTVVPDYATLHPTYAEVFNGG